ncbi:unnamed protein product [Heligmosomoides polygyrus]|uniref:Cation_ATPase_N domain-containing protein n=1 Tax=Heligmosomoides polygyrus TaxID=6339 RepID=A0A183GT23_HELPZ|nr:unnamed protein product [Heligmosomoides polygyrus]
MSFPSVPQNGFESMAQLLRGNHDDKIITVEETEVALKKMKPGKPTGSDDLAANLWKSKSWYPPEWLTMFFNQVVAEKKKPDTWQI